MDIFGHVAAKRKEIEEATKMNIAKSFQENLNPEVEEKKVEKSFDDELNEVHRELFGDDIEKAVYADTAQNRKLGRVGKEWAARKKSSKSKVNETKRKYTKEDFGKWKSPLMNYKNINQVKRELSQISKIESPTKEQKEKKIWLQGVVDNYSE